MPPQLDGILTETGRVGGGGFSDVYRGDWTQVGHAQPTQVAIKRHRGINTQDVSNPAEAQARFERRTRRETVIWRDARHDNILPFLGYQFNGASAVLVSPWCKNGCLSSYIRAHPELSRSQKLKLLKDAALGLEYLHSLQPPIIHADIKPENIMISDDIRAVLSDFGISRFMVEAGMQTGLTTSGGTPGTAGYQSKELLESDLRPTNKSDVYAFGGLILGIMSGKRPFHRVRAVATIILAIVAGSQPLAADHPDLPASDPLWDLLGPCWNPVPQERPSMTDIIEVL
ncbi:hypothetical protein M407DRAFT_122848 [Tulasnella calospora MUT 4182]|uniref:Protein kinase domain-containing protein n=1 Tax=Tulasnella calospora MUT 4182 TaxID=1051891 RepID=A0A0C3Q1A5_9AGAM|nr:hypothetical protein M407DRAFT_122848 [Tulasnella calospora MUT 4182]